MPKQVTEITADELAQIKAIARIHDINYKSVNFGENFLKIFNIQCNHHDLGQIRLVYYCYGKYHCTADLLFNRFEFE